MYYRSRLSKLEEKRSMRTASLLGLGTVVILTLAVVLGVPTIVRMAAFLGDLKSANKPDDKNDFIPPAPPILGNPYEATNSATQVITGSSESGAAIYLTKNGEAITNVIAAESGEFQFGDVKLSEGRNDFIAVAVDKGGNKSQNSPTLIIYYLNKQPKLEIETPSDGQQITGNARIEVKGKTDSNMRVTVNERLLIINSDGGFSTMVNLNPGENKIWVVVRDQAGNENKKEVTVTYSP